MKSYGIWNGKEVARERSRQAKAERRALKRRERQAVPYMSAQLPPWAMRPGGKGRWPGGSGS